MRTFAEIRQRMATMRTEASTLNITQKVNCRRLLNTLESAIDLYSIPTVHHFVDLLDDEMNAIISRRFLRRVDHEWGQIAQDTIQSLREYCEEGMTWDVWEIGTLTCIAGPYRDRKSANEAAAELEQQTRRHHLVVRFEGKYHELIQQWRG